MQTYYILNLTDDERNCILDFLKLKIVWSTSGNATSWANIERKLTNAEPHPNIEDLYQYEAEHSGFRDGDKVLLECEMLGCGERVSTVAIHCGTGSPSYVIPVPNNIIYHKD